MEWERKKERKEHELIINFNAVGMTISRTINQYDNIISMTNTHTHTLIIDN